MCGILATGCTLKKSVLLPFLSAKTDLQHIPSDPIIIPLNHATISLLKGIVIIFNFLFRNDCKDTVDYKTIVKKVKTRPDFSKRNRRRTGGGNSGVWLNASNHDDDDDSEFHLHFLCLNPAVAFVEMAKS